MNSNAEFISSVKFNGGIPEDQVDFTDAVILNLADEVLQQTLLPVIMEKQAEYFVFSQSFAVTANKKKYRIPSRAIGGVLRDVQLESGSGIRSLKQIDSEDVTTSQSGTPDSFYIEGNSICLYPTPSSTVDTLILKFSCKPGMLTPVTNASRVTNIAGNIVTLASVPSVIQIGVVTDFTKGSAHYEPAGLNYTVQTIGGNDVGFTSLPEDLEIGDWLSLAGTSPVPSIPEEFHSILSLFTAAKILQSLGQLDQEAALIQKAEGSLSRLSGILSPRISGEPQRIVTPLSW